MNKYRSRIFLPAIFGIAAFIAATIALPAISMDNRQETYRTIIWNSMSRPVSISMGYLLPPKKHRILLRPELDAIIKKHSRFLDQNRSLLSNIEIDLEKKYELIRNNPDRADLSEILLKDMDLSSVNLSWATLTGLWCVNVNLKDAQFMWADLKGANLERAHLERAHLELAHLIDANLLKAGLTEAHLERAHLVGANLKGADLRWAQFIGARLEGANLFGANLWGAELANANARGATLTDCALSEASLYSVLYEPRPGSMPDIHSMADAKYLETMRYEHSRSPMVALRAAFLKEGYEKQARKLTYAIKRSDMNVARKKGGFKGWLEWGVNSLLFDLTCGYGMNAFRPLLLMGSLILLLWPFYSLAVWKPKGADGIFRVWRQDRLRRELGGGAPVRLEGGGLYCLGYGLYFSLVSAFNIGWKDLNVGNWMSRMQRQEYDLRATGLARSVAGVQSILSVYFMALSVLSYFGNPFSN